MSTLKVQRIDGRCIVATPLVALDQLKALMIVAMVMVMLVNSQNDRLQFHCNNSFLSPHFCPCCLVLVSPPLISRPAQLQLEWYLVGLNSLLSQQKENGSSNARSRSKNYTVEYLSYVDAASQSWVYDCLLNYCARNMADSEWAVWYGIEKSTEHSAREHFVLN